MKLQAEDPRLSAYLLGELSEEDAAAVRLEVAGDPALGIALREMEQVQRLLTDALVVDRPMKLSSIQRDAIFAAARYADAEKHVVSFPVVGQKKIHWMAPVSVAAAVAVMVTVLMQVPAKQDLISKHVDASFTQGQISMDVATYPAPGPKDMSQGGSAAQQVGANGATQVVAERREAQERFGDLFLKKASERLASNPLPPEGQLPALSPRLSVDAKAHPSLALPVHAGRSSMHWIVRSIREEGKRPPAHAVRVEEVLNHFVFRTKGTSAMAQGVTLSAEAMKCPWRPSSTLLFVNLRGAAGQTHQVAAKWNSNLAAVSRYRLLGYSNVTGGRVGEQLPSRLPAGEQTSLMIEIETKGAATDLGAIQWHVDGAVAPELAVKWVRHQDSSEEARFAAFVCAYAQWLSGDTQGVLDAAFIAAMARENVSENLSADRVDFLNLVDQSLKF